MATRNPMNQRYQGEGPGGQTRKSAASAKPTSQAAGSVYIKKKPVTDAEKRAAKKAREKEAAAKAKAKSDRAAERARIAKAEAEAAEAEKAAAAAARAAEAAAAAADGEADAATGGAGGAGTAAAAGAAGAGGGTWEKLKKKLPFKSLRKSISDGTPKTTEYKKWRKVYWSLLGVGIAAVAVSFYMTSRDYYGTTSFIILMVIAYGAIIAAFVVDFRKVRPLVKKQQAKGTGKKTPKALKHEQEAAAQAAAVEAARKAAKASKKTQRRGKTVVPGEPDND